MEILGTDGELTWGPDADLTELGLKQAAETINAGNNNYLKVLLILNVSMFPVTETDQNPQYYLAKH